MKNFLDNLAARSLDSYEAIQPRLASLFEPPQIAMTATVGRSFPDAENELTEESLRQYVSEITTGNVSGVAQSENPQPMTPIQTPSHNMSLKSSSDIDNRITDGVAHNRERLSFSLLADPAPHAETMPELNSGARLQVIDNAANESREQKVKLSTLQPEVRQVMGEHSTASETKPHNETRATHNQDVTANSVFSPENGHSKRQAPESPAGGITSSTFVKRSPGKTPSSTTRSADAPMSQAITHAHAQESRPTVRITIGRVEVRAIMPLQTAPRPAPRPMQQEPSLDEYLKQRGRGRQ